MKKIFKILIVLAVLLSLSACTKNKQIENPSTTSIKSGDYLYEALNIEKMKDIKNSLPTAVYMRIDRSGNYKEVTITDKNEIKSIVDEFVKVRIKEETLESVTDNYNAIDFIFDDVEIPISLNLKNWEVSIDNELHYYVLDDFDGLWKIMSKYCDE